MEVACVVPVALEVTAVVCGNFPLVLVCVSFVFGIFMVVVSIGSVVLDCGC